MRRQTRDELETENKRLSEAFSLLQCFVSDLLSGRAAKQTRGSIQWIISRPGSPSGGCALIRDTKTEAWSIHTIFDAAQLAHNPTFRASYENDQAWTNNYEIGTEASRVQETAALAQHVNNTRETRIGLSVDLLNFRPIKLTTTTKPNKTEEA